MRYYYSVPPRVNIIGGTVTSIAQPISISGEVTVGGITLSGMSVDISQVTVTNTITAEISGDVGVTGTVNIGNTVPVTGDFAINQPIEISGDVTIGNTLTTEISGDVGVTGTVNIGNTVPVTGDFAINQPIEISGDVIIGNTVTTEVSGGVVITGIVRLSDPVEISGGVFISNTVITEVSGAVDIGNVVTITGDVGITGPVEISGDVIIGNTVSTEVSGNVGVTGTVDIGNTVTTEVSGNVGVTGTVDVGNTVTTEVSGNVGVTGTVDVGNTVTTEVSGAVTVGNTLTTEVSGNVGVTGTVDVGNTVTTEVSGAVTVGNTLTTEVSGNVGVTGTVDIGNTVTTEVSGAVTVGNTLTTEVSGNVGVTGTVDVGNTVITEVSGAINIGNTITTEVSGNVGVTGTVDIGNTVAVTGSVTVTNGLEISGTVAADISEVSVKNIGVASGINEIGTTVNASATFTSNHEQNYYPDVMTSFTSTQSGTLYYDFSNDLSLDGSGWSTFPVTGFNVTANIHEFHTAVKGPRYFRYRFINASGTTAATINSFVYYGTFRQGNLPLNQSITGDSDSSIVRAVATGANPDGTYVNSPTSGIVTSLSTNTPLISNEEYISSWTEATGWHGITINMAGVSIDDSVAPGTFYIQNSDDTEHILRDVPVAIDDIATAPLRTLGVTAKYYRFKYINGDVDLSQFHIHTMFHTHQVSLVSRLDQPIASSEDVNNVRAVVAGQTQSGIFRNVPVDSEGNLSIAIQNPRTAFGQIKVAETTSIIQAVFPYAVIHPQLYNQNLLNGGTITPSGGMLAFNTSANVAGHASLSTKRTVKYMPGVGIECVFSCVYGTPASNSTQYVGIGDTSDGFFIGYNGTDFGVLRRSNGTETFVSQTNFNNDKLDGTSYTNNFSGVLLNPTLGNVYRIQYQWLGFGAIRFSVESNIKGEFVLFHTIQYANQNAILSTRNPSQGIRWEVTNSGNASAIQMQSGSASCSVEGKIVRGGPPYFSTSASANGTTGYFYTIRNKDIYKNRFNKIPAFVRSMSLANDTTAGVTIQVILNASLTSASFADVNTNSVIEVDTAATAVTGGIVLATYTLAKNTGTNVNAEEFELDPGDSITLISDTANVSQTSAINWFEDI